jgi:hypothetical protein
MAKGDILGTEDEIKRVRTLWNLLDIEQSAKTLGVEVSSLKSWLHRRGISVNPGVAIYDAFTGTKIESRPCLEEMSFSRRDSLQKGALAYQPENVIEAIMSSSSLRESARKLNRVSTALRCFFKRSQSGRKLADEIYRRSDSPDWFRVWWAYDSKKNGRSLPTILTHVATAITVEEEEKKEPTSADEFVTVLQAIYKAAGYFEALVAELESYDSRLNNLKEVITKINADRNSLAEELRQRDEKLGELQSQIDTKPKLESLGTRVSRFLPLKRE